MSYTEYHKNFTLNGKSFENVQELLIFSKIISIEVYSFLNHWFSDSDSITVHTSGSTGRPKTIQLKKKYMVNSAMATGTYFNLPSKTTALLCLSPNYIAGKMMLVRALILGWHIDFVESNSDPLKQIKKQYDFSAMVPLQVENSLADLYKISKLIIGGAVVSNQLIKKLKDVQTSVFATYGMTETITHIAVKPLNEYAMSLRGGTTWQSQHYKTIPNIIISRDHRDCLIINAPNLSDTKITTNDIVELISRTEFKWLGRFDSIINSGGIKLIPEQIENKLSLVLDCRFFVCGVPNEKLGQKLVLVVENSKIKIENLRLKIQNLTSLNTYEIPKEIYEVESFVETKTKKIDRKKTVSTLIK